jgi:hypothetical protein
LFVLGALAGHCGAAKILRIAPSPLEPAATIRKTLQGPVGAT